MSRVRFAPRREIGRTGFVASAIGAGDLADPAVPEERLVATLARALEAGLNVVDTAPGYADGLSERVVGAALAGRPRESVFVIDKVDDLERPVGPQVDASLGRLRLAAVDLLVLHNVSEIEAWRAVSTAGGGLAQVGREVERGRARFRGISSHDPDVLEAAIESGLCDVLMFPVGPFVDDRYVEEILPRCRAAGIGAVSFKTFGAGKLLGDTEGYSNPLASNAPRGLPRLSVEECVRLTLTLDPDCALCGLSTPEEQDAAFDAVSAFRPLPPSEVARVRARAADAIRGKGQCWWNPLARSPR